MNSFNIYCHPSTLWYLSNNDDDYDDDEKKSEELVKKQYSRYDVLKEKPDDNLHPMSRFVFVTVKYDPKLGGDMGKYYVCVPTHLVFIISFFF
jgi:hypothetical protein